MKPTDLMIKDWVLWKNRYVQVVRISGIVYSFGHIDTLLAHCNDVGDGIETHDISKISPIPLTTEILEKNGWIQCKYETCKSLYEYKGLHLRHTMIKRSNGRWVANVNGNVEKFHDEYTHSFLRINVFYVHELQHALRLCGLIDLADNFKV